MTCRVLLVDDFEPWRRSIRSILGAYEQLQIVGEAADGSEAVRKASALKPDLVLLDIGLPTVNGMDAANQIRKATPRAKIIFVTQNRDVDVVNAALSNGERVGTSSRRASGRTSCQRSRQS